MCGIAGVWASDGRTAEAAVRAMTATQTHRGPDDQGVMTFNVPSGHLALGHRRLSIQDLSPLGHQPMENPETGDWIVFNGEIYNYPDLRAELVSGGARLRSRCDTEAILHAFARWGTGAFDRLEGMFALGLYVARERRLLLARDPLGIKPLYYAWDRGAFAFASELRGLEASGLVDPEIDRAALASLLAFGAVPGPLTMLREAKILDPGSWVSLDLAGSRPEERRPLRAVRYWDFPAPRDHPFDRARTHDEIRALLTSAVRSHLISDVPVGVFLSSGLDSTAIAVLAAEARQGDLDTFTIAREGDPESDEGPVARDTAKRLGVRHHQIDLTESVARRLAEDWLASLDQPSVDGLNTYIISHAVRQRGIIVALSGLGGDEVFGGYTTFREVPRLARLARAARGVPRGVRREMARLLYSGKTKAQRQKAVEMAGEAPSVPGLYFRRRRLLSDAEMAGLGLRSHELGLNDSYLPELSQPDRGLFKDDPVATVSVLESRFYMGNMLLRDSDVFGMAHGLEIRVPLLDRRLTDYAYALPGALRVDRGGPNKTLLAGALEGRLPPPLLALKKRGFTLPQARWMAGPLRDLFEGFIDATRRSGLVDPAGVDTIWRDFLAEPNGSTWSRAWIVGVLGAWLNRRSANPVDPPRYLDQSGASLR
ncbi:asparagine synthase (glutamine-hydrolysing) [Singulisphaera sp. GP187]|uniref:asparagine synthase (glutamine-hydrolyzing) n=1 Tax=Singulisphaera sp. GP187 TaxID=1882752 RepID=UPI00092ADAA4|nr:asparagine synthase (glutamine-hydrolyzing) [Singulisphaera sp. GP187]SIO55263.1 asparagine synthase (glutamine-hydrolysing) [Singulisphaera sp. GP187]